MSSEILYQANPDFNSILSHGLLIFNTDDNQFHFWNSGIDSWQTFGAQTLDLTANVLSISGGNSITLPADSDNQTLALVGQDLTISNGNTIILPVDSDNQTLSINGQNISITNGNTLSLPTDSDNQTLSVNGQNLSILGGNTITLPSGGGAFTTTANATSNSQGDYANDDFIFGSPQLDQSGNVDYQNRIFFDKSKGAFRAGNTSGTQWNSSLVGTYSVAMGASTTASGGVSVALGAFTTASANAAVAMGFNATASGNYSTALGSYVSTNSMDGSFIIGDYTNPPPAVTNSSAPREMTMRFDGGYRLFSNTALTSGVTLASGAGAWATISDRNKKENFKELSGETVLGKLLTIPISEWNYKSQNEQIRHIGPMAQDFYEAFGLGISNKTITTTDIDGINMLAIQALAQKTAGLEAKNKELSEKIERLEAKKQGIRISAIQYTESAKTNQKGIGTKWFIVG